MYGIYMKKSKYSLLIGSIMKIYDETLPYDIFKQPKSFNRAGCSPHLYVIAPRQSEKYKDRLKNNKIGTQVLYIPVHLQPYYLKKYGFKNGDFPIAEKYYKNCLSIPIFPHLKDHEVYHVINKINSIISL